MLCFICVLPTIKPTAFISQAYYVGPCCLLHTYARTDTEWGSLSRILFSYVYNAMSHIHMIMLMGQKIISVRDESRGTCLEKKLLCWGILWDFIAAFRIRTRANMHSGSSWDLTYVWLSSLYNTKRSGTICRFNMRTHYEGWLAFPMCRKCLLF